MITEPEKIRARPGALLLLCAWAFLAWCGAGCEGHAVTETLIIKNIGPDGGTILGPKGSKVIIPIGALDKEVTFKAQELPDDLIPENEARRRISIGLLLTPEKVEFERNITVELPFKRDEFSIEQQKSRIRAFSTLVSWARWEKLEGSVDVAQHVYRAETRHLSIFALFLVEPEKVDGDREVDLECGCVEMIGEWCPKEGETCSSLTKIEITPAEGECAYDIELIGDTHDPVPPFQVADCDDPGPVSLMLDGLGECRLSFQESGLSATLDCAGCFETFSPDYCDSGRANGGGGDDDRDPDSDLFQAEISR